MRNGEESCLRLCKDTKIKANHNSLREVTPKPELSKTLQRYENKSKSQLLMVCKTQQVGCLRLCKDTKIKANHNALRRHDDEVLLSKTLQRYENKSKSQRLALRCPRRLVV